MLLDDIIMGILTRHTGTVDGDVAARLGDITAHLDAEYQRLLALVPKQELLQSSSTVMPIVTFDEFNAKAKALFDALRQVCGSVWVDAKRLHGSLFPLLVAHVAPDLNMAALPHDFHTVRRALFVASFSKELFAHFDHPSMNMAAIQRPDSVSGSIVHYAFKSGEVAEVDARMVAQAARARYDSLDRLSVLELAAQEQDFATWHSHITSRLKAVWTENCETAWQECFGSGQIEGILRQTYLLHVLSRACDPTPRTFNCSAGQCVDFAVHTSFFNKQVTRLIRPYNHSILMICRCGMQARISGTGRLA